MSRSRSLLQSSAIVAAATLFSRLLGLGRDIVVAHLFGASMALDAFLIAFKLPNLLRRLFAEGAFAQGFIPVLTHAENLKKQISELAGGLILLGGVLTLVAEIFAPQWVMLFAPGFTKQSQEFDLTVSLLRITFPFLFFILLTALASAILNVNKRFALPALAPAWLNITTLVAAIWLAPYFNVPITALAWGIFVGGLLQCVFLLPAIASLNLLDWPSWHRRSKQITQTLFSMMPAVIGVSIGQLGLMADVILASFLPTGSISFLFYSDRLVSFPIALIGVAVASTVLPALAKSQVNDDAHTFKHSLSWGIRMIALLGLPAAMGLVILAGPIVATILKSGQFDVHDVIMTKNSLIAFACGTPALMFIKIFGAACNARKQSRVPCRFAIFALAVNVVLGWWWMHSDAHVGLAWATVVAVNLNALLLWIYLFNEGTVAWMQRSGIQGFRCSMDPADKPRDDEDEEKGNRVNHHLCLQLTIALTTMAAWLWWQTATLPTWLSWSYFSRWGHLAWLILSAMGVYGLTLAVVGLRHEIYTRPT